MYVFSEYLFEGLDFVDALGVRLNCNCLVMRGGWLVVGESGGRLVVLVLFGEDFHL